MEKIYVIIGSLMAWMIITLCVIGPGVAAGTMTSEKILETSDQARGSRSGIEWEITLESTDGKKIQKRTLNVKVKEFNSLVRYLSPSKVKNTKILMRDRNMWFIKPGLKKPVPISPRQKLLGAASNGDIASTNYAGDYIVTTMEEGSHDGIDCFVLDLKGKTKKTTYDRIKYWISKKDFLGIKADFYTVSGKKFKSATIEYDNSILVEGKQRPFISKMVITDSVLKGSVTTMEYSEVQIKKIPDAAFNINLLVR